jgi:hypothetical protein
MKAKVYIAVYESNHGLDVFAAGTQEELNRLCADYDNEPDDGSGYNLYCTKLEKEIDVQELQTFCELNSVWCSIPY